MHILVYMRCRVKSLFGPVQKYLFVACAAERRGRETRAERGLLVLRRVLRVVVVNFHIRDGRFYHDDTTDTT